MHNYARGFSLGLTAYLLWGSFPLIISMLAFANPFEIVVWRIVFGFLTAVVLIAATKSFKSLREVFKSSKFGTIAGSLVTSGIIRRNAKARVLRDSVVVGDNLAIESLRRFKDDATEVREGFECGIGLGSFNDVKVGDIIETFEMREKVLA